MKRVLLCVKNTLLILAIIIGLPMTIALAGVSPSAKAACNNGATFLGLPAWYRGLCNGDTVDLEGQELGLVVIKVALNVVDMMLRIVALVAFAFVVWGGFQYLVARGEPGNLAKAKATLTRAIIGLIVGIAASGIVGFIVGSI